MHLQTYFCPSFVIFAASFDFFQSTRFKKKNSIFINPTEAKLIPRECF